MTAVAVASLWAAGGAGAQTDPGATTTTTAAPATTTTAPAPTPPAPTPPSPQAPAPADTTPSTAKPSSPVTGVPSVPVHKPTTTTAPPGGPPPPPPDPGPAVDQVNSDLAQLTAISDFKPAQDLVSAAQQQVSATSGGLQSARQALLQAQTGEFLAAGHKAFADSQLRALAVAAYIGVGYSAPSAAGQGATNGQGPGNGNAGFGTVSTPDGLTGVASLDAKEMLVLVGQRARRNVDDAKTGVADAAKVTVQARAQLGHAQAAVSDAEANLLAAQRTLKVITTAATVPGAAATTPLPNLTGVTAPASPATPATSSGPAPTTTTSTTRPPARPAGAKTTTTVRSDGTSPPSPTILGPPVLNATALAAWFQSTGHQPNVTVPMDQLAADYDHWGQALGIRDDLAFAQSVIETGFFSFPAGGQLTQKDNNFAGIGACDSCAHGWTFPDANTGVEAQLQLLYDYATNSPLPSGVNSVIGPSGVGGCCSTWMALAGTWASSLVYGISIMTIYNQMLTWYIPQAEMDAGLIPRTTPAATPGKAVQPAPSTAPIPQGTSVYTAPQVKAAALKP